MEFYTSALVWSIGVAVAIGVIIYYYNKKLVPMRQAKGVPAQPLSRLITSMFANGYQTKTPFAWLSGKPFQNLPKGVLKLLNLRNFNYFLNILMIVLLALQFPSWWIVPIIQTLCNLIAYAPKHNQRNAIIGKMAKAAHKKLAWGPSALIAPWRFVKVQEWDGSTPVRIRLHLSTDYDATLPSTRENFQRSFNASVSSKNNWSYEWDTAEGFIAITPIALLPEKADYEGAGGFPWNQFPIGIGENGIVSYDISSYPHVLVGGTTGSGKSVLQRNIIFHCIQHNNMWRFLGVDLKRVELGAFKKYEETVMGIATELEDAVEVVRYAQRVMNTRYKQMEEEGVNHFLKMVDPKTGKTKERAILVMIDEAAMFMGTEGVKTDEGKARDELHGEAVGIIGALARLGRASGVHLLLATQRPDATFIPGEVKNNLDVRIAAGRLDATPSSMILDSMAATLLPGDIKGRGVVRYAGSNQEFQGFFAEQDWIDQWLEKNPGVEPTLFPAEGQITEKQLSDLDDNIDFSDGILELEADIMSESASEFALSIEDGFKEDREEGILESLDTGGKKKKLPWGKKDKDKEPQPNSEQTSAEANEAASEAEFDFVDDEYDTGDDSTSQTELKPLRSESTPESSSKDEEQLEALNVRQKFAEMFGDQLPADIREELMTMDIEVEESSLEGIPSFEEDEPNEAINIPQAPAHEPAKAAPEPIEQVQSEEPQLKKLTGIPPLKVPPSRNAGSPAGGLPIPSPKQKTGGISKLPPPPPPKM